ncbi:putative transposase [Bradyrhizobium sp. USDA 10063]
MIDREHELPVVRQAKVLNLARSTVYYQSRPVSAEDLALMRRLDELHLDYPFAGARMLRSLLRREGLSVGRRHVVRLMKRMGISAIYRRPNTSKPTPGHKLYPYLLRGVKVERPNHVWAMDISYVPMRRGFVYLAAVVDVASRRVLAHRVSITMEAACCIEALEEALARHGQPEIFNTDQGSQFTSQEFTSVLTAAGVSISMVPASSGATYGASVGQRPSVGSASFGLKRSSSSFLPGSRYTSAFMAEHPVHPGWALRLSAPSASSRLCPSISGQGEPR